MFDRLTTQTIKQLNHWIKNREYKVFNSALDILFCQNTITKREIRALEQTFKQDDRIIRYVENYDGNKIDFDMAIDLMDDDLREYVHLELAPCTMQSFFDCYCSVHYDHRGEDWELARD